MLLRRILSGGLFVTAIFSLASPAGAESFWTCTPTQVAITKDVPSSSDRVTLVCANALIDAGNSVIYFAVPFSDSAYANRFMSLASTALTTGRQLQVGYDSGKSTDFNNA